MFWWTEVFCDRRALEPLVFSVVPMVVHPLVHMITCFTYILFSALGACYKVDNIGRLTTGVASKLDGFPWPLTLRSVWGLSFCRFLHLALSHGRVSPGGSSSRPVSFELGTYKKIPQTLGSSVGHGRLFCEELAQSAGGRNDGPVFVDYIPHFLVSLGDKSTRKRLDSDLGL